MLKRDVIQSTEFFVGEMVIILVALSWMLIMPPNANLSLLFGLLATIFIYWIVGQQQKIKVLEAQLAEEKSREDDYVLRTEQLRRTLHDIRSPISALKLRIQLLQKTSCEPDQKHLARLEESLESAVKQLDMMSDIQKGKVKPTDTMLMKVDQIRAYLME